MVKTFSVNLILYLFFVFVQTKKAKLDIDSGLEKEQRFVLWWSLKSFELPLTHSSRVQLRARDEFLIDYLLKEKRYYMCYCCLRLFAEFILFMSYDCELAAEIL